MPVRSGSQPGAADAASRIARHWVIALALVGVFLWLVGAAAVVVYAGVYNIAADEPHSQAVYWLLNTARERSVAARATDIEVPHDLSDPQRISRGAGEYTEMCSECHLAPGMDRTEISQGLYPRAPQLRRKSDLTPAEQFWIIKHGVKMTGMPAWGVTHDDDLLWDLVAFVRKLPDMTADQYKKLVEKAPKHDEIMENMENMKNMKNMDMGSGHDHAQ